MPKLKIKSIVLTRKLRSQHGQFSVYVDLESLSNHSKEYEIGKSLILTQ